MHREHICHSITAPQHEGRRGAFPVSAHSCMYIIRLNKSQTKTHLRTLLKKQNVHNDIHASLAKERIHPHRKMIMRRLTCNAERQSSPTTAFTYCIPRRSDNTPLKIAKKIKQKLNRHITQEQRGKKDVQTTASEIWSLIGQRDREVYDNTTTLLEGKPQQTNNYTPI